MKLKGITAIAEAFEVTGRTVRNWRDQGAPISKTYEADPGEIHLWRAKYRRGAGGEARQGSFSSEQGKEFQETRLKRLHADKLEREALRDRGKLLSADAVRKLFDENIFMAKANLLLLENSLPPLLELKQAKEIAPILKHYLQDVCARMAGEAERYLTSLQISREPVMSWEELCTELRHFCNHYGIRFKGD